MREKRMGDIGMLKKGVLACLLDGKGRVFDGEVVDHQGIVGGLGVYREERGRSNIINTQQQKESQSMTV